MMPATDHRLVKAMMPKPIMVKILSAGGFPENWSTMATEALAGAMMASDVKAWKIGLNTMTSINFSHQATPPAFPPCGGSISLGRPCTIDLPSLWRYGKACLKLAPRARIRFAAADIGC